MNKTQAIVFFGIIVIGAILSFFILTKPDPQPKAAHPAPSPPATASPDADPHSIPKAESTPPESPKTSQQMAAAADKASSPQPAKEPPAAQPTPPAKPPGGFTTEKALMDALAKAIADNNPKLLFELAGNDTISESARAHLSELLKKGALKLDPKQPLAAIGRTQTSTRWALRLVGPSNDLIEILTDLVRDPNTGWGVEKMHLPAKVVEMKSMAASGPTAGKTSTTGPASEALEHPDALMVAYDFSKAVIARDIKSARALTDPKRLNNEKLAALLIALEEGAFQLKADKPLVVTLSRDDLAWAIARVESGGTESEFGVEMAPSPDGGWMVSGLTFSKLITMTAEAAGAGDVAYSPIHKNPQGGESLVLYFEFDNEQVSARTRKQLVIVADILGQDTNRKIHINGHADAKGEDNYNIALSKRRTDAVKNTLVELGVSPGQIVTKAFGETMPLKPNFKSDGSDNPAGRAQNRRTEIYLDF